MVERCFGLQFGSPENDAKAQALFKSPLWLSINRGELSRDEAELAYSQTLGLTASESQALFFHAMDHQIAIEGTEDLARRLKAAGYRIFGLTDNVHEIVAHLREHHSFWLLFEGVVVSAEVGLLKPDQRIFQRMIETFDLRPSETVFLDDVSQNVAGARAAGLEACVFTSASACERNLKALGLAFQSPAPQE